MSSITSIAGGYNQSKSDSSTDSYQRGTNVWAPQAPYLQDLYSRAQNTFGMGEQAVTNQGNQLQTQYRNLDAFQNPTVDPRFQMYAQQIGQNFGEQILPQIQGQAIQAGGLGNSRQQLAQGVAGAEAVKQMSNFGAQLYGENQDRAMNAINMQNQISGQQGNLPWATLQNYQGLLGAPVMQDLGGYSISKSKNRSYGGEMAGSAK